MLTEDFVQSTMDRVRYWREKTLLLRAAIRSQQRGMTRMKRRIAAMNLEKFWLENTAESNPKMTYAEVRAAIEAERKQYAALRAEERLDKMQKVG